MTENDAQEVITATRIWIERVVVRLDLCPFARRELERDTVRYSACWDNNPADVLQALMDEVSILEQDAGIETTLLIHPNALTDFLDYNDFLGTAEALLESTGHEGIFQLASFHPEYQFADAEPDAVENYTNRSPFPMLHLLREASVSAAVEHYADIDDVPARNIARLRSLGRDGLNTLLSTPG